MVYTNNNFNPNANLKNRTSTSLNKAKPTPQEQLAEKRKSLKKITDNKGPLIKKEGKKGVPLPPPKEKKVENPFLVSNPFYLDEDERMQLELEKKEREVKEKELEK